MKKRILWLTVSLLIILSLVLVSCGKTSPATTTPSQTQPTVAKTTTSQATVTTKTTTTTNTSTTPASNTVTITLKKMDGSTVQRTLEKPTYGGTVTFVNNMVPLGWDDAFTAYADCRVNPLIYDRILGGDYTKGPAGTNETDWSYAAFDPKFLGGALAESWELTDPLTLTFHIRKGVHWQNKAPVNGREMNADDIVYSIKRGMASPVSNIALALAQSKPVITEPDKWTVISKAPNADGTGVALQNLTGLLNIVPHEMIEQYGDMRKWQNSCGTGPFMLTDYVDSVSATLIRNPDYWMKDPLFPQNQLPYADGVKMLLITDSTTQLAAVRTGKVDQTGGTSAIPWEAGESLIKTNPELKYSRDLDPYANNIGFRLDKSDLPFKDIRVRQALMMAIDWNGWVKDYYHGNAEILSFPLAPVAFYKNVFTPLDKLPASVQGLYSYNVPKAKQLLADAGYPNGFPAEILCWSTYTDRLSILKGYWDKIGVVTKIDVREQTVWKSILNSHAQNQMAIANRSFVTAYGMLDYLPNQVADISLVNDPKAVDTFAKLSANFFNYTERDKVMKDWFPYALEQVYYITVPHEYLYTFWEPWVKNYYGEFSIGYSHRLDWPTFVWIDQKLKKDMGK